jgi:hypothetical protein
MRNLLISATALTALLVAAGCASYGSKASKSVEQVMESGFEGKESLAAKINKGEGSAADFATMAALTRELTLNKPPKGDLESWAAKTTALNLAAADLAAGKPGALDAFKSAVNCKACHTAHKPD